MNTVQHESTAEHEQRADQRRAPVMTARTAEHDEHDAGKSKARFRRALR